MPKPSIRSKLTGKPEQEVQEPQPFGTEPLTRTLRIIAQDPSVKLGSGHGKPRQILTTEVTIPCERLEAGPRGYRLHVIDYDATTETLYAPKALPPSGDPYRNAADSVLLSDPGFHAQNVYAIVMRTLGSFEFALGRRVSWAFDSHQLQVAPHAFAIANAFYSRRDQALLFGYFSMPDGNAFTCLSHDIVAHETTHAVLDGLRERYTDPSSIDQLAFHEGFADVIALLSVFSLEKVVRVLLNEDAATSERKLIPKRLTTEAALTQSALFGLGEQIGSAMPASRGDALRRSVTLPEDPKILSQEEFEEPHRRGEVFVAAMMKAFVKVWVSRLSTLGEVQRGMLQLDRVVEDGAKAAKHLMTMAIRALDYCPPTALTFRQYLTALLIADEEIQADDSQYRYRDALQESFGKFGIKRESNSWKLSEQEQNALSYRRTHAEALARDPDEVFRFVWENRVALQLHLLAYTKVISLRPCTRLSTEGFILRETVAEYIQLASLPSSELARLIGRAMPEGTSDDDQVRLYGGGTLIFDEFGRLKYHASNPVLANQDHLAELWDRGYFEEGSANRFSQLHLNRATSLPLMAPKGETAW